jgi:hypothetical protein
MGRREERKKIYSKNTSKLRLRYQLYHRKDLDETNPTTPEKTPEGDHSRPYLLPKASEPLATFRRQV